MNWLCDEMVLFQFCYKYVSHCRSLQYVHNTLHTQKKNETKQNTKKSEK